MTYFGSFALDSEKDMLIKLDLEQEHMTFVMETPNHTTGNLMNNFARLCQLPVRTNERGLLEMYGEVPCYIDSSNQEIYIFRLCNTKVANIYPDGRIERKANVSAIAKTLMSQTKDYKLDAAKTIFKTFIRKEVKFRSDLHTHMNGNLKPEVLMALGIAHQIRYPLYYVRKLNLQLTPVQEKRLEEQRKHVEPQFADSGLTGKYLRRKIDDQTFINFADLLLNNPENQAENTAKIRNSLAIMKDGQAVFTNLEKVYLYRYVFCKGIPDAAPIEIHAEQVQDEEIRSVLKQMLCDRRNPAYKDNTVFQDKLLWIARGYQSQGIRYAEISDTTLVKKYESVRMLEQVHAVMPAIQEETGVCIRFLAALRRIPLTIVKDQAPAQNYLQTNLEVLKAVERDPYVAGCDFVGEEINDIIELKPVIAEIVKICLQDPDFVIRIHAGENDSLKDNMSHSILCVKEALAPGQAFPKMRLGHGLYTHKLNSPKGRQLLQELKENNIVLEFQITSNVRLNNLNSLKNHPLRDYLKEGIRCVQGTDGGALYGTTCIDEQITLEKLLDLSQEDLMSMKQTETEVIRESMAAFARKQRNFAEWLKEDDRTDRLLAEMEESTVSSTVMEDSTRQRAASQLKAQIRQLPWDKAPIVLAGGSFNTENRSTHVTEEGILQMEKMMDVLDPEDVFFVIGHRVSGYERYLVEHNRRDFAVYAIVPSMITERQCSRLRKAQVYIRLSTEATDMGIYKSFNYEIFERRPSTVIAFDGNSACANLIQEAKNGKGHASIFLWSRCSALKEKEESLEGYVRFFDEEHPLDLRILEAGNREKGIRKEE